MQLSLQHVWPVLASNPPIAGQTVLFNLVFKTAAIHTAMAISTPVRRNVIISNRKTLIVKVDISNSAKKDSISIRKTRRNPARRGSKSLGSDDMEKGCAANSRRPPTPPRKQAPKDIRWVKIPITARCCCSAGNRIGG